MKKQLLIMTITLGMLAFLASCSMTKQETKQIPPAPVAESAPVATKDQQQTTSKTVVAVTTATPVPAKTTPATTPVPAGKSLSEKIDEASPSMTLDDATALINALSDPANDPDGKLTQKAIAKGQAIAKELIDTAKTEESITYYLSLLDQAEKAYGTLLKEANVDIKMYTDLADERLCAIQAYAKNSIYYYLKNYPKGHYTKELASLLSKKIKK
jgi:hypothetical protein